VGADGLVADTWRIGLLAGYSRSDIDLDARLSSADMDSYHLGLYGGTGWALPGGTVSMRGGLAYSWHDIETSRSVGFLGFGPEVLSADDDAGSFQAFGELGYGMETATARLEPFISLAHVRTRTGQFAETGGAAALTVSGNTMDTTFTKIGIRGETGIELGEFDVRLSGMLGWRHAMGDTTPVSDHSFTGADGFTIAGSAIARNSAVIDAGFAFDLTPDATLGMAYQGQFASDARDHGLRAKLAVRF
jgi:outer membrane autotransporter protein